MNSSVNSYNRCYLGSRLLQEHGLNLPPGAQTTSPVRGSNEVFVDDLGMFLGFVLSRPGP